MWKVLHLERHRAERQVVAPSLVALSLHPWEMPLRAVDPEFLPVCPLRDRIDQRLLPEVVPSRKVRRQRQRHVERQGVAPSSAA